MVSESASGEQPSAPVTVLEKSRYRTHRVGDAGYMGLEGNIAAAGGCPHAVILTILASKNAPKISNTARRLRQLRNFIMGRNAACPGASTSYSSSSSLSRWAAPASPSAT